MTGEIPPETSEEEAADLLAELVSIDTQNPPGREEPLAEFIHEWLESRGIDAKIVDRPDPDRPQVVAEIGAGDPDAGRLVLNGHMDVVPPGNRDRWSVDPFSGVVADGKVYGRGASDMKAGLAAAMLAGRAAEFSGAVDGKLILTFAMGEETAEPGTKTLLEDIDADYGVVLEPTELHVHTVGKGLAWYAVEIGGKSSHASKPELGNNALDALLRNEGRLSAYRRRITERTHPLIGESLCTPTMVSAGTKENVIPESAELRMDRRFLPSEDVDDLDEEIDDVFDPLREEGFEVSVNRVRTYEAAEIDPDEHVATVFRKHANDVAGVDTTPAGKNAATDQRNFVNDAGIPAIIWGPGTSPQSHTTDEWARVDLLYHSVDVLCRAVEDLCSIPVEGT